MNFKKIIPILSLPLFLVSCSKGLIRYGVNPYIEIETVEKGELIDYEPSKIKEKIDNKDSFVLFLHKAYCYYFSCHSSTYLKQASPLPSGESWRGAFFIIPTAYHHSTGHQRRRSPERCICARSDPDRQRHTRWWCLRGTSCVCGRCPRATPSHTPHAPS